jgi:hypothetical protein
VEFKNDRGNKMINEELVNAIIKIGEYKDFLFNMNLEELREDMMNNGARDEYNFEDETRLIFWSVSGHLTHENLILLLETAKKFGYKVDVYGEGGNESDEKLQIFLIRDD